MELRPCLVAPIPPRQLQVESDGTGWKAFDAIDRNLSDDTFFTLLPSWIGANNELPHHQIYIIDQ